MIDAARLATPVGDGGILWHPSNLDDIYSIPSRTLLLFDFYRVGTIARLQPWTWWRIKDKRTMTHQYVTDWKAVPQSPARCGYEPPTGSEMERYDIGHCTRCEQLDKGIAQQASGTVAGVQVGQQRLHGPSEGA